MFKARLLLLAAAPALMLAACHKSGAAGGTAAAATAPVPPAPPGGWVAQVAATPDGGYRMGNADAPVKLVEYGSRTCPHCAAFAAEGLDPLRKDYISTGRVSYEFRDFPIHQPDMAAILLGRCAGPQAFFSLLEQMFAMLPQVDDKLTNLSPAVAQQLQGKSLTDQAAMWGDILGYTQFVGQRGVPAAKAQACLHDQAAVDAVGNTLNTATAKYNINSTPTFLVNGEVAGDAHNWATVKAALDGALHA